MNTREAFFGVSKKVKPMVLPLVKLRVSPIVETLGVNTARNTNGYALGFSRRVKPKALLLVQLRVSPIVKLLALAKEQSQKLCSW